MIALILACSRAKRVPGKQVWGKQDGRGRMTAPAVLVYDGPLWRVLRRHNPRVAVFALSGRFGLFPATDLIPCYDVRMPDRPDPGWLRTHVLDRWPGGREVAVWACVPAGGGYGAAVEALCEAGVFVRDIIEFLRPEERTGHPYLARMKALARFCRHHAGAVCPLPEGTGPDGWLRLVSDGEVLGPTVVPYWEPPSHSSPAGRMPSDVREDLTMMVLSYVADEPGIWTARLCRRINGLPETNRAVAWCGLCRDYANPRKRERARRLGKPLPGMEATLQIHPPCPTVPFRLLQDLLGLLEEATMVFGRREEIPDPRNARGWDFATRWYPL